MANLAQIAPAPGASACFDVIENIDVLISRINAAHAEAQAYASKAIERALEAGDLLLRAKTQVSHGQWQSWLKANCPDISIRTAQNYMRVAKQLPIEKRIDAHLGLNEALRLVASEPEPEKRIDAHLPDIPFLPAPGEMAVFNDDDWDYSITQSSQHPGYYWVQRWFNDAAGDAEFDALYRHDEPMDSDYNLHLMRMFERRVIPCTIYRRPMNEQGVNAILQKWKVQDEHWTLLGPSECDASVPEIMGLAEWERHKRETWPKHRMEAQS